MSRGRAGVPARLPGMIPLPDPHARLEPLRRVEPRWRLAYGTRLIYTHEAVDQWRILTRAGHGQYPALDTIRRHLLAAGWTQHPANPDLWIAP